MNNHESYSSNPQTQRLLTRWSVRGPLIARVLALAGMAVVLVATLSPFHFAIRSTLAQYSLLELIKTFLKGPSSVDDIINNVLLFMPLGFGLAMLQPRRSLVWMLLRTCLVGAALSFSVELMQLFLPSRTSTPIDVVTNTTGAVLGAMCWRMVRFSFESIQKLQFSLMFSMCAVFALVIALQFSSHLVNWNTNYSLLVGNELPGNRQWHGDVYELEILDRAIAADELAPRTDYGEHTIVNYRFDGSKTFADTTGTMSELRWQGDQPDAPPVDHVSIDANSWLRSKDTAAPLTEALRRTSQFTIITTVASTEVEQYGPARIVTVSSGADRRNFTIGQLGSALVFRLRTPGTGQNAAYPQFFAPGVFADSTPRRIVITYDTDTIRLYVDGALYPNTLHLSKERALFVNLVPPEFRYNLGSLLMKTGRATEFVYQVFYLLLICAPASVLAVVLMRQHAPRAVSGRVVWSVGAALLVGVVFCLLPPLLCSRPLDPIEIITCIAMMLLGIALCWVVGQHFFPEPASEPLRIEPAKA